MTSLRGVIAIWRQDNLLRKVLRNTGYLFAGNMLSTVVQSIFAARLLGVLGFGILGTVISFASNINRLLSFRMGELVVKYVGQSLAEGKKQHAAAAFKAAALTETLTSVAAYLLLVLAAPLAARHIIKDETTTLLIVIYGLALLANFAAESSTGLLQVGGHFRSQAAIGLVQSLLTAGLIVYAYLIHGTIWLVLGAYLLGKSINGLALVGFALWRARQMFGPGWMRASFKLLPGRREFWGFAVSTNLSGTITMMTRDNEEVWISLLLSPLQVGYYKVAKAVINLVVLPITPFISTTYPETTRAVAEKAWQRLRDLLGRLTLIATAWTGVVTVGLIIFGHWLITRFYGVDFAPSFPAMLILLVGFGFANIFYWNRNLLLSLGMPNDPLKVMAVAGLVKITLSFLLVPRFGYLMETVLMSAFFVVSIGLIVLRGIREVRHRARESAPTGSQSFAAELPRSLSSDPPSQGGLAKRPEQTPRRLLQRLTAGFANPGINRWDWLVVSFFLAFAGLYFLGRLQGNYPVVILTGDGGNIASYAAAMDHPDWFKADPVLGDSNNIGIYATIHIPLISALARQTGDYGLAYAWLVLPETFLQLLGFYVLGRVLFKNRFWAFLLAFITAMTVINIGLGEIWGVWQDALPRVTFQSLLPFLLALVLVWKDRPGRWPWLMVFVGLLVYVHPISAPAWGFAIWLSLWLLQPKSWGWQRRFLVMAGLGVLFLAAIAPFAINYFSYQARGEVVDYSTVMAVLQAYSPANLLNAPAALGNFLWNMTRSLLIPVALVGFVATWLLKKSDCMPVKVVLVWMTGIFIISILIPFTERMVEQHFHILPLETELVRCIRYLVPLFLSFWLWPLAEAAPRFVNPQARRAVFALGIVLFGFWGATNRPAVRDMLQAVSCFSKARLVCVSDRPIDDLIITLRTQTQPGEGVLFFNEDTAYTSQTLSVRYSAMRPLVYTSRDSGILGYSNRSALPTWLAITKQVETIRGMTAPQERLDCLVPLAESLNASYLVIDFKVAPESISSLPVTVVMQNEGFSLLKLR